MIKSPFYLVDDFISPLMCENMVDECDFNVPNKNKDQQHIKTVVKNIEESESIIYDRIQQLIPNIEQYYNFQYKGINTIQFEWFPIDSFQNHTAENSKIVNNKWVRHNINDFTGVLFLSDYQDNPPLDDEFEVYGGKLEFLYHKFGFNPKRGLLVIFPSDPHFVNSTSRVLLGNLYQVRIQITSDPHWNYDLKKFPGNYTTWF